MLKGENLLEYVDYAPTSYYRNIARTPWSKEELSNSIVTGERFGVHGVSPQSHDSNAAGPLSWLIADEEQTLMANLFR